MKTLYFDCFSGISGDMTLGAFIDMGIELSWLKAEIGKVHLHGYTIKAKKAVKNGITGTKLDVKLTKHEHHDHDYDHHHEHHDHNSLKEILVLIEDSHITEGAKAIATAIFKRLADAEAAVHGSTPDEVHFHEVGAIDSIVDIVGCAVCVDKLAPDKIISAPMCDGSGFVMCQHGKIPVPVPAVCQLAKDRGTTLETKPVKGELITPTGAAILCELAHEFGPMPIIRVEQSGYGAGTKDFEFPNMLRLVFGDSDGPADTVWLLEANLDDITGETLGFAMEQFFENGALDVYYTPIFMKKNRPAYMLSVICREPDKFEGLIFKHTSTLGIRRQLIQRTALSREIVELNGCRFKVWSAGGTTKFAPEYEDVAKTAREKNKSFTEAYSEMMRNYEAVYSK